MPAQVTLPDTAPFAPEQIAALNRVIAPASTEQRQWLSGFLAGWHAATAAPAPAAAPRKAPLTILFATESGNAEALAATARQAAGRKGFAAQVHDMADFTPAQAAQARNLLIIASTWGEGDPPQRGADFYNALMVDDAPRFDGVRFAVLALGDRAYANFCSVGRRFDERLEKLGGVRAGPRIECDLDYEAQAGAWIDETLGRLDTTPAEADAAVIHVDFARAAAAEPAYSKAHPFEAEITVHVDLASSRAGRQLFHVELALPESGFAYEPGDAIGFLPANDPALADALLGAAGLAGDAALRASLIERLDITTLTGAQVAQYGRLTGDAAVAELAADEARLRAFLPGRQVIDLLEAAPHPLSPEQLAGLLRPLPPRLYSVASSRKLVGEEAHLLIAALRYESHGRARSGVASVDVAERRAAGGRMKVYLKPNPHFRLPADTDRPIIMIGPGTGVAPFRAFLQEREATGARGKSWLFFGNRHFTHDFLYQLEWQEWLKSGVLNRIDLAFSRDQPERIHVQHRLWEQRADLRAWIGAGAAIYVCGDAAAMAKDVHATLVRVLAEDGGGDGSAKLDALRREGRYLRDVY